MEPIESILTKGGMDEIVHKRGHDVPEYRSDSRVSNSSCEKGQLSTVSAPGSDIGRVSLPETILHWSMWIFGCLYSTYRLRRVINENPDALDAYSSPGWIPGLSSVDKSDDEFEVFIKGQLSVFAVFMVIHLVLGHFLRSLAMFKVLPLFHVILSGFYLTFSVGIVRFLLLLSTTLLMFVVSRARSRSLCWLTLSAVLLSHHRILRYLVGVDYSDEAENRSYIATAVQMWGLCRCVMFCFDHSDRPARLAQHDNVVTFLGYVFYAPVALGPLIVYGDYLASLQTSAVTASMGERVRRLAKTLLRVFFWLAVMEVANHLIHIHSLRYSPDDVARLFGRWELAGLNYWSGQYFHIKYVVCYGMACALADFEGIVTPLQPRCVSWIAVYSDMWKYFDHGLYKFMTNYIYVPLLGSRQPSALRKTIASIAVFGFVFAWHGLMTHLLIWSVANFFCVTAERLADLVASTRPYADWRRVVGGGLARRCHALLAAPLFMISMACQVGFLNNSGELGWTMAAEMLAPPGAAELLLTLAFMYCGVQVMFDVKRWRYQRTRLEKEPRKLL